MRKSNSIQLSWAEALDGGRIRNQILWWKRSTSPKRLGPR